MSIRLLLGVLVPVLSGFGNETTFKKVETSPKDSEIIIDFQTPAKFHVGMLSISLIIGLVFGGFITYKAWEEKNIFLGYIRNLVIALVCRTFFSILFDGVILLGTPLDVAGGNTLVSFEQIFLNLVLAFWLTLTIYIHARVQNSFNSEPSLRLYEYGVPGVAMFFVLVWIFTLQDQVPSVVWWIVLSPFTQWIVNSLNLLFLLIQLALVGDIARMMMKMSLDNDSISLLRNISILAGVLILIFWLQFGFVIGRVPLQNSTAFVYFHCFIDGLECALVCLVLYFFSKWVSILLNKISSLMIGNEETPTRMSKPSEVLLNGYDDRRIVTVDSVFMTSESKRWKVSEEERTKDIVYSNIVEPQRLKKTLELYKRFDIIPTNRVTVVEGEEFYDCQKQSSLESNDYEDSKLTSKQPQSFQVFKRIATSENINFRNEMACEQTQKKNAFYSSKYLILDSKESDFPKYLETRPSVSSMSGKDSLKEGRPNKDSPSHLDSLMSDELVRRWLFDNSENMQKNEEKKTGICLTREKEYLKASKDENLEISKHKSTSDSLVKTESQPRQKESQASMTQTIVSSISSVMSNVLFPSSKSERRNSNKELSAPDEIKIAVNEQNNAKKFIETFTQLKPEITESPETKVLKKNAKSVDTLMNTNLNVEPQKKVETMMNVKEIEKFHSEAQMRAIKTSERVSGNSWNNLKSETKEDPEEFKNKSNKSAKKQKPGRANGAESTLSEKNNPDVIAQSNYPESIKFQQRQLINEQPPKVSKEQFEKLTENKHHNDLNFEMENKNLYDYLNFKNKAEEQESFEHQMYSAIAAYKRENTETNDVASKSSHDSKLGSELALSLPETEMELVPADSTKKQKFEDTALTPSDVQNSDKLTEPLDQYITYSELLNFRSEREKETESQPSFSFSEAISLAIGSLINASGSFFLPKKNYQDNEKLQQVETREIEKSDESLIMNNYQVPQNEIDEELENLQRLKNKQQDVTHKIRNIEIENQDIYDSLNFKNKTEEQESFEPQIGSAALAPKMEGKEAQVLSEAIRDSESELELSVFDFKIIEGISMKIDAVKEQTPNRVEDLSSPEDEFDSSRELQFQSQQDEPTTAQPSKDPENINVFDNLIEMERQSKKFEITENASTLKYKTSSNDTKKHSEAFTSDEQKSFGNFSESIVTKPDVNIRDTQKPYTKELEQSQDKRYEEGVLMDSKNQTNISDSESEFSIEKREDSSSSASSFSLDRYYAEIMNVQKKFQNPLPSVYDKPRRKLKIHK